MINKPSVFSRIKVTSPAIEALKAEVKSERKSFVESLTTDQLSNLFPASANLGTTSDGKPISRDAIAQQDSTVPIAQTQNGSKVMTDPVTGQLVIVSDNPSDVQIQKPEDAAKLQQLALLAKQTQTQQAAAPSKQDETHQQNIAQQRAVQQQTTQRVSENDTMSEFIDNLNQIFTSGPKYGNKAEEPEDDNVYTQNSPAEKTPEETEEKVEDEETSEDVEESEVAPHSSDGLVEVNPVGDTLLSSPDDVLTSMGASFWTPPGQNNLAQHVAQAQANIGAIAGPVEETPINTAPPVVQRPNMAQYVKTGMNLPGSGNAISTDFDDILGIESPYAIKLALTIGK